MGMYTEIVVSTRIVADDNIINIIQYMLNGGDVPSVLPDHSLFKTDRWSIMLRWSSYYFVPHNISFFEFDNIGKYWVLISRSDFKNYDQEITKFFDWVKPYVESEGMIGYSRYEENWEPIIYYKGDK